MAEEEKVNTHTDVQIPKALAWFVGAIILAGTTGGIATILDLKSDVAVLKMDKEKQLNIQRINTKQWEKLSQLDKYMYTFHGYEILGIPREQTEHTE